MAARRSPLFFVAPILLTTAFGLLATAAPAQNSFVNFETPHCHPLDLTPDGSRLLAVNTADGRLEVFDSSGPNLVPLFSVPVGIDPVSVRARTNDEAWVANNVSDSVSIVRLSSRNVVTTLKTDDEPCDVVFAGTPSKAYVSCSQARTVLVFDPANLATAPTSLTIDAESPRAMAVNANGTKVFVAIFESGNSSTILGGGSTMNNGFPPNVVSNAAGPYGGVNPPPNSGTSFNPPINPALPAPPKVGLIVKRNAANQWRDDNTGDWTSFVTGANAPLSGRPVGWDMPDHDVAIIDTASNGVTYANKLMNICMAIAVNPGNGQITIVGTDAANQIRFEPVLKGLFIRVGLSRVNPGPPPSLVGANDLNPHLALAVPPVAQSERDKSLGDPRGIVWNAAGTKGYVTGMGSNNVIVIDPAGLRVGLAPTIPVGEGPTGIVLDAAHARLLVMDKFEGKISVVDIVTETETARVAFFDPSPSAIKVGRKHLYDTHKNSGMGQIACGSCHIDARMDRLAWDLGDPSGSMKTTAGQNSPGGNAPDWHPMKGPMTTQTLQDIIGKEPLHWRGDRAGLEEFNGAFIGLQGDDANLTPAEMQEYENFLATITFPPNPFRNFDNSLPTNLPLPGHFKTGRFGPAGQPLPNGNAVAGLASYRPPNLLDGGALACVTCHTLPSGVGPDATFNGSQWVPFPVGPNGERHHALVTIDGSTNVTMKVPELRNVLDKVGFDTTQLSNRAGFGFLHDGSVDSIARFVNEPVFNVTSDQQTANLVALMLSFAGSGSALPQGSPTSTFEPPGTPGKDVPAAVGAQSTLVDNANPQTGQLAFIASMIAQADTGTVGLVVKGVQLGIQRGYAYIGGDQFQSDRSGERLFSAALRAGAQPGSELTYTVVARGTQTRIGIDRDLDGCLDRDELDQGSDPADATSHACGPHTPYCSGDGSLATACPCGNFGVAGRGCANSQAGSAGAWMTAAGSTSPDTVVLSGSGMPPTANAIYLQGDASAPSGIVFGDGVRCVNGSLKRLGVETGVNGASQYPGTGEPAITVRSAALGDTITPGSTRFYQTYYRDPAPAFCPAPPGNTWNVTNGASIIW